MKKRQTRVSISVRGLTHQRAQAWCDANGIAVSALMERLIHDAMDEAEQPRETVLRPRSKRRCHVSPKDAGGVKVW